MESHDYDRRVFIYHDSAEFCTIFSGLRGKRLWKEVTSGSAMHKQLKHAIVILKRAHHRKGTVWTHSQHFFLMFKKNTKAALIWLKMQ